MPLIFLHQDRPVKERRGRLYRSPRDVQRIAELEAALRGLVLKSTDHIIAGHPINSDALDALREAERVLTKS